MSANTQESNHSSRREQCRSARAEADSDAVIPFPQDPGSPAVQSKRGRSAASGDGPFSMPLDDDAEAAITALLCDVDQAACLWFRTGKYGVVEEVYGPKVALKLMRIVEARLRECVRGNDLLCRVTPNEFVILLSDPESSADAAAVAERLQRHCSGIYQSGGLKLHMTAGVGMAMYPGDATQTHDLLRFARMALRQVDPDGQSRCRSYSPELLTRVRDRAGMIAELEGALQQDRLVLHYQPQYSIDTRRVVGVEALVRMVSESGELIGPNHYIELAEETNQILELGRWVIEQACQQLGCWRRAGLNRVTMAVNVSPRQLMEADFCDIVDAAVAHAGIAYNDLELEITERQVVENLAHVEQTLRKLTAQGVRVAVDDFGTGFSSLAYLMQLSLTKVKVDRAFMTRVPYDERAGRVVNVIIAMARQLGLEHTVEGIETDAQHRFLLESGCERGQGYNFARPQTAEAIERLLR